MSLEGTRILVTCGLLISQGLASISFSVFLREVLGLFFQLLPVAVALSTVELWPSSLSLGLWPTFTLFFLKLVFSHG